MYKNTTQKKPRKLQKKKAKKATADHVRVIIKNKNVLENILFA